MISGEMLSRAGTAMLFSFGLAACSIVAPIVNSPPSAEEDDKRISELVGRFEQTCLGRDLMSAPYPSADKRIREKTGIWEVKPGSCNFWDTAGANWGQYDKTFISYNRSGIVREFKRRFGVIYHDSAPISPHCATGERHMMLLRDSTTWITLKFLAKDDSNRLCYEDKWLAYGFQLTQGGPAFLDNLDADEPYVVDRLDVANLDRLSAEDRQKVAERWAHMSAEAKDKHKKQIADAIQRIRNSLEIARQQYHRDQARQQEFNQRLQRQEESNAAAFNEMLIGKLGEVYQQSAEVNARNANQIQQRAIMARANAAFSEIKGFDASQLPSSISLTATSSSGYGNGSGSISNDVSSGGNEACDRSSLPAYKWCGCSTETREAYDQCLCEANGGTVKPDNVSWVCSSGKKPKKTGPGTPR